MSDTHYDTKRAAAYLGITSKFLEALRHRGGGPVFAKLGRRVVYAKQQLDCWVTANSRRTTHDNHVAPTEYL